MLYGCGLVLGGCGHIPARAGATIDAPLAFATVGGAEALGALPHNSGGRSQAWRWSLNTMGRSFRDWIRFPCKSAQGGSVEGGGVGGEVI